MLATTVPLPLMPNSSQTLGALMLSRFHSTPLTVGSCSAGSSSGSWSSLSAAMEATSGRAAIFSASDLSPVTLRVLLIQYEVECAPAFFTRASMPAWVVVACRFLAAMRALSRPTRVFAPFAAEVSALEPSCTQNVVVSFLSSCRTTSVSALPSSWDAGVGAGSAEAGTAARSGTPMARVSAAAIRPCRRASCCLTYALSFQRVLLRGRHGCGPGPEARPHRTGVRGQPRSGRWVTRIVLTSGWSEGLANRRLSCPSPTWTVNVRASAR